MPEVSGFVGYQERVWIPWWTWLVYLIPVGVLSVIVVVQSIWGIPVGNRPASTFALLVVDAFLIFIAVSFSHLSIRVDQKGINLRFGLARKEIPTAEILSCEITEARFGTYFGVGLRYGIDGSLAFIPSLGSAVKVMRKGRPVIFSTHRSSEVTKVVNTLARGNP